jgi:hypothetical protein
MREAVADLGPCLDRQYLADVSRIGAHLPRERRLARLALDEGRHVSASYVLDVHAEIKPGFSVAKNNSDTDFC